MTPKCLFSIVTFHLLSIIKSLIMAHFNVDKSKDGIQSSIKTSHIVIELD